MLRREDEVRARLAAADAELRRLRQVIAQLTPCVVEGRAGWRADLEALAHCYRQCRAVCIEMEILRWVLTPAAGQRGSEERSGWATPVAGAAERSAW